MVEMDSEVTIVALARNNLAVRALEVAEKFEKYFGYLARCEENFGMQTLWQTNHSFDIKNLSRHSSRIDKKENSKFELPKP